MAKPVVFTQISSITKHHVLVVIFTISLGFHSPRRFSESARKASAVDTSSIHDDENDFKVFRKGCFDCSPLYTKSQAVIRLLTISFLHFASIYSLININFKNQPYLIAIFLIFYIPSSLISVFIIIQALRALFPGTKTCCMSKLNENADWGYANGFIAELPCEEKFHNVQKVLDSVQLDARGTKSWKGGNRRCGVTRQFSE